MTVKKMGFADPEPGGVYLHTRLGKPMRRVEFQQLALRKISEILVNLLPLLRSHGLSTPGPIVEDDLWEESDPREISIRLYRGTEFVDFIEFFIWKGGYA